MKTVLVTTAGNQFGGVLATAYKKADGPPWSLIIVLSDRNDIGFPAWAKGFVAFKLLGVSGIARLARISALPKALTAVEKDLGLHEKWLSCMSFPDTQIHHTSSINSKETQELLSQLVPDVLVSIGAPTIFKRRILEMPRLGAINLHNGRIPKYRGHFGTFWEVMHGEKWAYVCVHEMEPKVDSGRLLAYDKVDVKTSRSFLDLLIEKKQRGGQILAYVMTEIERLGFVPAGISFAEVIESASDLDYFGFPSLSDIRRFSWHRHGR